MRLYVHNKKRGVTYWAGRYPNGTELVSGRLAIEIDEDSVKRYACNPSNYVFVMAETVEQAQELACAQ